MERDNDGGIKANELSAPAPTTPLWKPIAAIGSVAIVFITMWFAYAYWIQPNVIQIKTGYVPFAGLIVVSAALERLLEPLSDVLLPKDSPKPNSPQQKAARAKTAAEQAASDPEKTPR